MQYCHKESPWLFSCIHLKGVNPVWVLLLERIFIAFLCFTISHYFGYVMCFMEQTEFVLRSTVKKMITLWTLSIVMKRKLWRKSPWVQITGSEKGFPFNMRNRLNNWLNLKDSSLHCLNTDLIVCQFNFEEHQLVQAKLIVKREKKDNTPLSLSLAFLYFSPEPCALRFVAPNRLHGSEHRSMSE